MSLCPAVRFCGKVSKQGNASEECEDEFAIFAEEGKFALADGATEAAYSNVWARILVNAFRQLDLFNLDVETLSAWVERCRGNWFEWQVSLFSKELPWFTREKLSEGCGSTFLGISFDLESASGAQIIWKVIATGDSCVFMVRDTWLRFSFPVERAEDFTNAPPLLRTLRYPLRDEWRIHAGSACAGDKVYLATDALASWYLHLYEKGGKPWETLDAIATDEDFRTFVSECRSNDRMRNDDVGLVIIRLEAARGSHE